jgi:predicted metal-dependent peptidase
MSIDWAALGLKQEEIERRMSKVKVKLFAKKNSTFLASIMGQLRFEWDDRLDPPTAATNGIYIKWHPEFFAKHKVDAMITVLAHEIWHVAYDHMGRIKHRHPMIWNMAADHVINLMLEGAGYSFEGLEFCCKDPRFEDMTTEQVYEILYQEMMGGSGGGQDPDPSGSGQGPGQGTPVPIMSGDLIPTQTDEEHVQVLNKVVQAAQAARMAKQAGDLPGEITLTLDKFLNPKLPWQTLLRRWFTEKDRTDWSYRRPNRRYEDIRPGLQGDNGLPVINAYQDVSGSVEDADILRFNSEFKHIKDEYAPELVRLCTFDTQIQNEWSFGEDDPFEQVVVTGRGGTSLKCVRSHILKTQPAVAIIFTDLECDQMGSVGNIPVLWICVGNPSATVPFGDILHIDNED